MKVLHGTWIPDSISAHSFTQGGAFYVWVESDRTCSFRKAGQQETPRHPCQLAQKDLADFIQQDLGLTIPQHLSVAALIQPKFFQLPSTANQPLPSPVITRTIEAETTSSNGVHKTSANNKSANNFSTPEPAEVTWQTWQIDCYKVRHYSRAKQETTGISALFAWLKELHFLAEYQLTDVQLGDDLLFWYHYIQAFKQVILKDHYIPALRYREQLVSTPATAQSSRETKGSARGRRANKGTSRKRATQTTAQPKVRFETYPYWEIISEPYQAKLTQYAAAMPPVCTSGFETPPEAIQLYNPKTLLQHCSECLLQDLVVQTTLPQSFLKKIDGTLIYSCLRSTHWTTNAPLELYGQWQPWRDRIARSHADDPFTLCFQLHAPEHPEDLWQLIFMVSPKEFPSLRIELADYWPLLPHQQAALKLQLGDTFEQGLLFALGDAARIYPQLTEGLETAEPVGIALNVDEAFDFLNEAAWVLEDAGYRVVVPSWWTPDGRRRAKLRLRAQGKSGKSEPQKKSAAKGYFSLETLVEYQYELSIGGEAVSEQEWQQLVATQAPLVQFRGEWIALDPAKMQEMLIFWQKHRAKNPEMGLLDFMQMAAQAEQDIEIDFSRDRTLVEMMDKLSRPSALVPAENPTALSGQLRDYQKRGVAWLHYLESLGLNGCLADDMGLGKTVQVIARLLQEKEQIGQQSNKKRRSQGQLPPTLLIAPTSVLGNWYRELEKFAPSLTATVHHGSDRPKTEKPFQRLANQHDLVITSFSLARRDSELFSSVQWHRIVLDEAQNIKNPKTAQTKAILRLQGQHRLALTGTPIENRLMDLWSIFNFLNPGYLGKQNQFRKSFELPVQRDNDRRQSAVLKKLVEPFILRRVKTDQAIIKDLPSKVEQKTYCNLTKEQAALYEAVVRNVEKQLTEAEGIQRKGLILSTLMKLKQICNHPRQFLQDGSDFSQQRSHKLSRLTDMVNEAIADGDSLLIFTQFREIGDAMSQYLRDQHHHSTYYLHGGTPRQKRERMIASFQSSKTPPAIFILSLKAGGVGITLTKANHVFHFDRWWNPAVEDQATDRAFRIGQKKNVFVHKFVSLGTLEERIDQMIEDKKKLAGSIVGTDETWLTELDNNAFKQLIALNKTAILG